MRTQAVEDYLKTIYEIQHFHRRVSTSMLAEHLDVAPASVTGMLKKLAEMELVSYEPYHGVVLTETGKKIALEVIRHHRLIELFLTETLGMTWDQVDKEAHKIEHVLSQDLVERIDNVLGNPTTDPHGAPIPDRDGSIAYLPCVRLDELQPGESATVIEVDDDDPARLRYLGELGLYPGVDIKVVVVAPFGGPLTVSIEESEHALGREVAHHIFVSNPKEKE
jgi:DtxR family Mn-dependent transcriptional regulator